MSNTITLTGNATATPEARQTGTGKQVVNFSIADNRRIQVNGEWQDADPTFFEVTAWGDLAGHVATNLVRGQRVTVTGRLETQTWEAEDGPRKKLVLIAEDVALSLRFGLKA